MKTLGKVNYGKLDVASAQYSGVMRVYLPKFRGPETKMSTESSHRYRMWSLCPVLYLSLSVFALFFIIPSSHWSLVIYHWIIFLFPPCNTLHIPPLLTTCLLNSILSFLHQSVLHYSHLIYCFREPAFPARLSITTFLSHISGSFFLFLRSCSSAALLPFNRSCNLFSPSLFSRFTSSPPFFSLTFSIHCFISP